MGQERTGATPATPATPATAAADVAAYFDRLRTEHGDTQIRGISGTCRFDIDAVGSWLLILDDGQLDARHGGGATDSVVSCTAGEFLSVVRGEQNGFTAALQGRLGVSGDLALVLLLGRIGV